MSKYLLLIILLSSVLFCGAATYYVDFASGNDASDGTGTGTAFKTIPGTRKADDTGFLNAAWGSFTSSARVPDNTTFKIKSGTTHNSANGGYVWMSDGSGHFYNSGCTNLVFQVDSSWGSGTTIIDGQGMTAGIALWVCQVDGVTLQGFTVQNATNDGVQIKEHQGSGLMITNTVISSMMFSNNGVKGSDDLSGSGLAHLAVRHAHNLTVTNCTFIGNNNWLNGMILGETHKYIQGSAFVGNCVAYGHVGDIPNNDSGIGFKAMNGQIVFTNCVSTNNNKGFDCGEQSGDNQAITYTFLNCNAISNNWGIGINAVGSAYSGAVNFYVVNCLIQSNYFRGINNYAGPFASYIVQNVFAYNGNGATDEGNMRITPNSWSDSQTIVAHVYNNVFLKNAAAPTCLSSGYFEPTNNVFTLDLDYNAYSAGPSDKSFKWSYFYSGGTGQAVDFSFGANGPGHASGNWYNWYGKDTSPPASGTGHFHCDANSKGTGCSDTTLPPLDTNYFPTNRYAGLNLSGQSWFIPEMGVDRAGHARMYWDIGMYESAHQNIITGGTVLRNAVLQ